VRLSVMILAMCMASLAYGCKTTQPGQPPVAHVAEADAPACERAAAPDGQAHVVYIPDDEYDNRPWLAAGRFSEIASTHERPVEVCLLEEQVAFMLRLACDDGTRPFADPEEVRRARRGSAGLGGRCGSHVDVFDVPCPEGPYEVFIDFYMCPERLRALGEIPSLFAVIDEGNTLALPGGYWPIRSGEWTGLVRVDGAPRPIFAVGPASDDDDEELVEEALAQLGAEPVGPISARKGLLVTDVVHRGERAIAVSFVERRDGQPDQALVATVLVDLEQAPGKARQAGEVELLERIARGSGPNDHRYVDYASVLEASLLVLAEQEDLTILAERHGDLVFPALEGWRVTPSRAGVTTRGDDGTFLCWHDRAFDHRAMGTVVDELLYGSASDKVILFQGTLDGGEGRAVIDLGASVVAIHLAHADPGILACSWLSSRERFFEGDGAALFEVLVSTVELSGQPDGAGGR
jgi:hypothetical protein